MCNIVLTIILYTVYVLITSYYNMKEGDTMATFPWQSYEKMTASEHEQKPSVTDPDDHALDPTDPDDPTESTESLEPTEPVE